MNDRMNRKSQITIFVILALIILIAAGVYFYLQASSIKVKPPVENLEVSDDIKPIQTYVLSCLDSVSREALIKLGNNGGYIDVSGFKISPIAYDSDVYLFEPQQLPYWYYMHDCQQSNFGCIDSLRPALCDNKDYCPINSRGENSIEEQLNVYIKENINNCIDDFNTFNDRFSVKAGNLNVKTSINDKDVQFVLEYPLDINLKGTEKRAEIKSFVVSQDVRLKDVYELATNITIAESKTRFLEEMTLNLISIYSGLDESKLPPFREIQFGLNKHTWTRTKVRETLQNDVLPYMGFVQILGTPNSVSLLSADLSDYSIYADGIYKSLEVDVLNQTTDLEARILYTYPDIYLSIGNSEIIKPEQLNADNFVMKLTGIFLTEYKFKYDISYPLIVQIRDDNAFKGEGYTFSYAVETNIRKNTAIKGNLTTIEKGGLGGFEFDSGLQMPLRNITIESYDKNTGLPLESVIITYSCGNNYVIGETKPINNNVNNIALMARMPFCEFGGRVIFEKKGYMGSWVEFNNKEGSDAKNFKVELWPIKDMEIVVLKRTASNIQNIRSSGSGAIASYGKEAVNISANESVFLSVSREKKDPFETDVPLTGFILYSRSPVVLPTIEDNKKMILQYYNDGQIDEKTKNELILELSSLNQSAQAITFETFKMDMVPGVYTADAFIVYANQIIIPKETREFCAVPVFGVCVAGKKTIELKEQKFDSWISGGAKINFTLTENDVYTKNKIIFYVLEQPIPLNWKMIEEYKGIEQYQAGKNYLVRPRFE